LIFSREKDSETGYQGRGGKWVGLLHIGTPVMKPADEKK
jgi:hypothetical protein